MRCSAPGPPAGGKPLKRAAGGNTLGPQGREGAAGRPGEGPGLRPQQAAAPGMQRRGLKRLSGADNHSAQQETPARASPRPSLAPGSSRLQDAAPRFGEDLPLEWLICYSSDSQSQRPAGNTCGRASCLAPLWPQAALSSRSQPWCARPRQSTEQEPSLPRPQHGGLGLACAEAAAGCAGADREDGPDCSSADFADFRPGRSGPRGAGRPVKYPGGPCALHLRAVWKGNAPPDRSPGPAHPTLRAGSRRPGQTPGGGQRPSSPACSPKPRAGATLGTHSSGSRGRLPSAPRPSHWQWFGEGTPPGTPVHPLL